MSGARLGWALAAVTLAVLPAPLVAQSRRAVVVGIDRYSDAPRAAGAGAAAASPFAARAVPDLENAVADAQAFAALLRGRFGFAPDDVTLLLDESATRAAILRALEQLARESAPGDAAVFYFVGHGSRIASSHPDSRGGLDQTLVPFDSRSGAADIWDKELRSLLGDVLDTGADLTAILGSCYSGDATRSGSAPWIQVDAMSLYPDVPVDDRPAPSDRGALVLSAARPDQLANFVPREVREGGVVRRVQRGLFGWHLGQVLRSVPVDEPAERVFLRVRALMRAEPYRQEPTLEPWGDREALARPLFGAPSPDVSGDVVVGVVASGPDAVELDGGHALGLDVGCELELAGAPEGEGPVRLRVAEIIDLARARADVTGGDGGRVRPGLDLFRVTRWTAPSDALLRVHVPPPLADGADLDVVRACAAVLAADPSLLWVEDPTAVAPTHVVRFDGATWLLESARGPVILGRELDAAAVRAVLADAPTPSIFLQVPPSRAALADLERIARRCAIELVGREDAHYRYVGRFPASGGAAEYALALPIRAGRPAAPTELPRRTRWMAAQPGGGGSELSEDLRTDVLTLARVRGWLTLQPPPDDGRFPYRLAVERPAAPAPGEPHVAANGEPYRFGLVADAARLGRRVQARYLYLLGISGDDGGCTLLWSSGGRLPKAGGSFADPEYPARIELEGAAPIVGTGLGTTDTFVLVSTRDAIANVGSLSWSPLAGAPPLADPHAVRGADDLGALLGGVNVGVRAPGVAPAAWGLSRARVLGSDGLAGPGRYELWLHGFQPLNERGQPVCVNRLVAPRAGLLRVTARATADLPGLDLCVLRADETSAGTVVAAEPGLTTAIAVDAGEEFSVALSGSLSEAGAAFVPLELRIEFEDGR